MPEKIKKAKKSDSAPPVEASVPEPAVVEEAPPAPVEAPVLAAYRVDAHLLPPELWGSEGDERAVVCVEALSVAGAVEAAQADIAFVPAACLVHGPGGSTLVA